MTVVAELVGKGGQLLLVPRRPFCPARDCERRCGAADCSCRPCRCGCRGRRLYRRTKAPTPDLTALLTPHAAQPSLFPIPTRRKP